MDALWPWLAVAALGALHGANPASGWVCARSARALVPLAIGHLASVGAVAIAFPAALASGVMLDGALLQVIAGSLLALLAASHVLRCGFHLPEVGGARLALWSFAMASAHGTGLMLVPALVPLCLDGTPARDLTAAGSLLVSLSAVALHLAAMLVVMAVLGRIADTWRRWRAGA